MAVSSVSQQQEKVSIRDLSPGTWYNIRVTAHNVAGSTVAEYEVATLTIEGGEYMLLNNETCNFFKMVLI